MSKRHQWRRSFCGRLQTIWACEICLMRRRWKVKRSGERTVGRWEYLGKSVSRWEHASSTCGSCPGKEAKNG